MTELSLRGAMTVDETYDLVIIRAGGAGHAAGHLARTLGGSVAIVDRELFGGSCPYWGCMPPKALLHAAAIHHLGASIPGNAPRTSATG